MANSSKKPARQKPAKPRPDFPLYAHASGKWGKRIRGKDYYFGTWADPEGALREYLEQKDDLQAGRTPKGKGAPTIRDLCNSFVDHCKAKLAAGEMVERTYRDYRKSMDRIVRVLGKNRTIEGLAPTDFARLRADIVEGRGAVAVSNEITRCKVVFNFAQKSDLIQTKPRFGLSFQRPSAKAMRQARAANGGRMFYAAECRKLLEAARGPEIKAMLLLGLNCGFGNSDCANLPVDAVDLDRAMIDWPRPKTAIDRRCPLWPEMVDALETVLARRRAGRVLVFETERKNSFGKDTGCISKQFRKVLDSTGLYRKGRNFYSLRHVFRTVADATKDFPAVRLIMGHADASIDAVYREHIDDARLRAVVDHVRAWLFPAEEAKKNS